MQSQKNSWTFGSETGGDLFFLVWRSPRLRISKKEKKVITCLADENPTICCKSSIPPKKRSQTEFERLVFDQLLLNALTVTHPEARGPAATPQRSGFRPRSAS